ncbi:MULTISPECIES: pilus assembly protein [unclassified Pseudoalteromonas]|uniref:Flp family type IVb pilin n=1 Tax=unclassified Pseudoalteromonas TaxID=194690 RepID=UPI000CF73A86|nr:MULTISPECIES: pilus assembly protein [unclassified Pseudoalteromonas]MBS3796832.1 pilus assembly protein [Pseudoalteromonas sp. BDTF-M6]
MKQRQLGQGMVEYIIIVALIAVSAIGVYSLFGQTIRNQVSGLATEVGGQNSSAQIQAAQDSAKDAQDNADQEYNLGNYNEGAAQESGGSGN